MLWSVCVVLAVLWGVCRMLYDPSNLSISSIHSNDGEPRLGLGEVSNLNWVYPDVSKGIQFDELWPMPPFDTSSVDVTLSMVPTPVPDTISPGQLIPTEAAICYDPYVQSSMAYQTLEISEELDIDMSSFIERVGPPATNQAKPFRCSVAGYNATFAIGSRLR